VISPVHDAAMLQPPSTKLRCLVNKLFCDTGLAFWEDKHCQNSFAILAHLALDLAAAPTSHAYAERSFPARGDMRAGN